MIRGMGASKLGMSWEQLRTEVIANNLANVNTLGFKRSTAVGSEFGAMVLSRLGDLDAPLNDPPLVGRLGNGVTVSELATDESDGSPQLTGNPLDVMIQGPGLFTYLGPNGVGYTRAGNFHQDAEGQLVTEEGNPVLVNGKAVGTRHPDGTVDQIEINDQGVVLVDQQEVGALDIAGRDATTRFMPRALEGSNTDMAQEMSDLIITLRSFQANQRAMTIQDGTVAKAANELGKV